MRSLFDQMIENEFRLFLVYAREESGIRIIFSNSYLIVLYSQYVVLPLKVFGYPSVIVFMMCGFLVSFFLSIYPLVIRVDKKKELKIWPQLSQDWPIHHFNHMILFHFCWFWFDRVESIGYLIKWIMTFKTLAKMDHWEN